MQAAKHRSARFVASARRPEPPEGAAPAGSNDGALTSRISPGRIEESAIRVGTTRAAVR
ncbi:hypothetical protein AEGHOMDF_6066 [Methylobacterium soli]|nr:hypothetical protein AEGHOMDF_6066 [Methylobacterium soli]